MIVQRITSIDELLQFVNGLAQKHGLNLWYRGEDDADLPLIPSIQRTQKRIDVERFITNDFYMKARQIMNNPPDK
nr:FRG domain-containing protein [Lachnospiraceae bacterium]